MASTAPNPEVLLDLIEYHLHRVVEFDPYKRFPGVQDRTSFAAMISQDPAFSPFGLEDERYIIARIGGNLITSLHRKIGDLYEAMFQYLLKCRFGLDEDAFKFSVDVVIGDRTQKRSTDGVVPISALANAALPLLGSSWQDTEGLAFEVRSCYQIGDSKRIQADWDMALMLEENSLTPVMLVFCSTSLKSPIARLRNSWNLFEGEDTFNFIQELTHYDLKGFLGQSQPYIARLIQDSLSKL